jgi:hypothetical protein
MYEKRRFGKLCRLGRNDRCGGGGLVAYFFLPEGLRQLQELPRACTAEAKVCPDGSAVGRTGPNCKFAPCPTYP